MEATDSICPLGWQLPYGGDKSAWGSTTSKSFGNLLRVYGLVKSGGEAVLTLLSSPLSFVYAGYYNIKDGSVANIDNYGKYWSATAVASHVGGYLSFYTAYVNPQDDFVRGAGLSARCVAR